MASRYSSAPKYDYCFHPVHVIDDDKDIYVPCGKCDGCLLHKAQVWSMRVGVEIESTPFSIFFTLTYSNKYLPVMLQDEIIPSVDFDIVHVVWKVNNSNNIRFDGKKDKLRKEDFDYISSVYQPVPITNFHDDFVCPSDSSCYDIQHFMPYSSLRDVQLWLKLINKDLRQFFNYDSNSEKSAFRYFIISEYGETLFRPHIHGVIFPNSKDQAEYLLRYSLYKNWQMCDKNLFDKYAHFCDSGVKGYITQYLTSFSCLPDIYKKNKEFKPFRISSKAPAIGFILQDKEKIFEDISVGIIEYTKKISRLGLSSVLRYPSDFICSILPKCYRYRWLDFSRVLSVYGCILRAYDARNRWQEFGLSFTDLLDGFRQNLNPLDFTAAYRCFRTIQDFRSRGIGLTVFHYCYLVDMYYYESAMYSLRSWYRFQESCSDSLVSLSTYSSSLWLLRDSNPVLFCNFIEGFHLDVDYWLNSDVKVLQELLSNSRFVYHQHYMCDVDDIIENMVKLPKFNEKFGFSPVNQYV